MFYNSLSNTEFNNCVSMGACSTSPNISSMQEVMSVLLRQIAYYLVKLHSCGVVEREIAIEVIKEIANADAVRDFSEAQILNSFSNQYNNLVRVRKEYLGLCKKQGKPCIDLKHLIKLSPKTSLSEILKMGDKEFLQKFKRQSSSQKYMSEILNSVMKSVCVNIITLEDFQQNTLEAVNIVLEALNLFNKTKITNLKLMIEKIATLDIELLSLINIVQKENFGVIEKVHVSHSTTPNKAIMVSGSNLLDLQHVLEAVEGTEIDVYTNGNLLIAHSFPSFQKYSCLKGHFGNGVFNSILDFATFPGAILLTKNEAQNIEYLYRGRLFTTDEIVPKGVIKIENNDFSPLIESALQAKGFAKGQKREAETVGYSVEELDKIIDKISNNLSGRLYIVGLSNMSSMQKTYFKQFYKLIDKKDFVITFSQDPNLENVFAFNLGADYALLYEVLHKIFEKIPVNSDKLVFFLTKCDVNSLSNIINLKNSGAKKIFLSDCPPTVINPAVLRAFAKTFDIKNITNPKDDMKI